MFHLTYPLPGVGYATSAQRVARLLHPPWSNARYMAVLKGYLDASGTDPRQKVVAVAGWSATETEWDSWERDWLPFIAETGLKKGWHHTDFLSRHGEYENWKDAKFLWADGELRRIFRKLKLFGVGAAVWREQYQELWRTGQWLMPRDPYAYCLDDCLEVLVHRLHEVPKDEGMAIYIDQDDPAREKLGSAMAEWHGAYLKQNAEAQNPDREVSVTYGSRRQFIPLQAADVLVNETYRYMFAETGIPNLGAVFVGQQDKAARLLIEAIKDQCFLVVHLYSKARLEAELEWAASGQYRPDGRYIGVPPNRRFIPSSEEG